MHPVHRKLRLCTLVENKRYFYCQPDRLFISIRTVLSCSTEARPVVDALAQNFRTFLAPKRTFSNLATELGRSEQLELVVAGELTIRILGTGQIPVKCGNLTVRPQKPSENPRHGFKTMEDPPFDSQST